MISETAAVRRAVKRAKKMRLRTHDYRNAPQGRRKTRKYISAGRSVDLGHLAIAEIRRDEQERHIAAALEQRTRTERTIDWRLHAWSSVPYGKRQQLKRRVGKKLRQPHRRKDRGPKRRRAAGKNNVRPSRGMRR